MAVAISCVMKDIQTLSTMVWAAIAAMPYKGGAYGVGVASQSSLEII